MRGRKPPPVRLKAYVEEGENPEKNPFAERPEPPEHLGEQEKEAWNGLCDLLEELSLGAKANGPLLELYAATYVLWRKARDTLIAEGVVAATAMGNDKPHPAVGAFMVLGRQLKDYLMELGLTPTARARMGMGGGGGGKDGSSVADEFLDGKRKTLPVAKGKRKKA